MFTAFLIPFIFLPDYAPPPSPLFLPDLLSFSFTWAPRVPAHIQTRTAPLPIFYFCLCLYAYHLISCLVTTMCFSSILSPSRSHSLTPSVASLSSTLLSFILLPTQNCYLTLAAQSSNTFTYIHLFLLHQLLHLLHHQHPQTSVVTMLQLALKPYTILLQ